MKTISVPKKIIFSIIFLFLATFFTIFIGEGSLFLISKISSKEFFQLPKIVLDDYPKNPQDYIKIALYGGSAGSGYLSEKKETDILRLDLEAFYPDKKFYIKNYASPGHPFHNVQAELMKEDIDRFDYFIVYSGTNEGQIYIDNSGFFRKAEYKDSKFKKFGDPKENLKLRPGFNTDSTLISFLKNNSRIYKVTTTLINRLKPAGKEQQLYHFWNFKEFSDEIIFPQSEVDKIYSNFQNDLVQIADMIIKKNKHLIMMPEITNQFWKPGFSIFSQQTTPEQKEKIKKLFYQARESYLQKKYSESIDLLRKAMTIDSEPAILHHYLGLNLFVFGKKSEAKKELAEGIAKDPWHARANKIHYEIEENIAKKSPANFDFINPTEDFYHLYEQGLTSPEIFSDFMHPNLLGHIILGKNLFCSISKKLSPSKPNCPDLSKESPIEIQKNYRQKLNVSPWDQAENLFLSARFNIGMSDYVTAYPEDILELGEYFLNKYYELSSKSDFESVRYAIFKSLIESKRGNIDMALTTLNQALNKYNKQVTSFLNEALNNGLYINQALADRGVIFNQANKHFEKVIK